MLRSTMPFLPHLLLAGYAVCVCILDAILFLIAAFYRRKFNEASPRLGFIVGGVLCILLMVSIFMPALPPEIAHITQGVLLAGAALSSGSATVMLYFIMRRSKK
jgi:hypothetical protein